MNNRAWIIVAILFAVMGSFAHRSAAINGDREVRINFKYYPKHYSTPPRWMRKLFSLPKREMANYLVFQLACSIAHLVIGVLNVMILLLDFSWSRFLFGCILIFMSAVTILDAMVFILFLKIFKHSK